MEQITSNVYVETGNLGSNDSIIVTDQGTVLVDAPHKPTDAARWRDIVNSFGEVSYLVHTDHHIDHTLGNFLLPGTVVSHSVTRRRMAENYPSSTYVVDLLSIIDPEGLALMPNFSLRLPTITFDNRMELHLGNVTVELIHLAGHTANSLVAYLPEQRVLFSGDNVCEAGLPSFQDSRVGSLFQTLDYISSLDFEILVPGHGEVGTKKTVESFRDQARNLVGQVQEAARAGVPREEAADRIRFEDRIHTGTQSYVGYPDNLIEGFQRRSVLSMYDQLTHDEPDLNSKREAEK
jgi:glyoxylase-like metal-dependent hydrolase (beta-lactamase superfamily II)